MPAPGLAGERNTFAHNTVTRAAVEYTDAAAVWAGYEAGLTIDHNSLDQLPYSGISVGWGWNQPDSQKSVLRDNRITDNRITNVMRVKDAQHDGGAIYTQGAQPGTVVSGNYINRSAYGNTERDGNGIYLDEQSSYITVENNVLTRLGYKWVSNWADYGIQNTARGNWTDTDTPPIAGTGSTMSDNHTRLEQLPAPALRIAAAAGAHRAPSSSSAPTWPEPAPRPSRPPTGPPPHSPSTETPPPTPGRSPSRAPGGRWTWGRCTMSGRSRSGTTRPPRRPASTSARTTGPSTSQARRCGPPCWT